MTHWSGVIDAAVTALAATQHGVLSRAQLIELGIPRRRWRRGIEEGWLSVAGRGVYAVAGSPESLTRRLWLGLLVLGPTAVVSHEAAAWLHRFDRCVDDRAEFTVPRARRSAGVGLIVHSTRSLPAIDRTRVDGLACTSATRTILDLAATGITTGRLEAAIDSAVRSGATSAVVLERRLQQRRGPGQAGTALLERVLPDSGGHSPLERRFLTLMRTAGLPRPRPQVVHRRDGRTFARVDFLFEPDVVVEVSGRRGHASDAERAKDAQRRNELQDAGRRVFEYTAQQVFEQPDHVVETMRHRLWSGSGPPVRPES